MWENSQYLAERKAVIDRFLAPLFAARDRRLARVGKKTTTGKGPYLIERRTGTGTTFKFYAESPRGMFEGVKI